jgi:hypothetical protein
MASAQSVLVSAIALVGAVSVSVVSMAALLLVCEVVRSTVPIDHRELRGSLGRLYWGRLSPLVHRPGRRFVVRAGIALVFVIARAIPSLW